MTPIARGARVLRRRSPDCYGLVLRTFEREGRSYARVFWEVSRRESTVRVAALVHESERPAPYDWREIPL